MNPEEKIERLLADGAEVIFDRTNAEEGHLDASFINEHVASGTALNEAQIEHVARCAACREDLAIAIDESTAPPAPIPLFGRRWLLTAPLAVAASLAVFFVMKEGPATNHAPPANYKPEKGAGTKGSTGELRTDVTFLAIDDAGIRRELRAGQAVLRSEKLGFVYGNPESAHKTLTVLGWDGSKIHWYYPDAKGKKPFAIDGGPKVLSIRLPFDVKLDDHAPGTLTIAAAFDHPPSELAKALRTGDKLSRTKLLKIRVE